MNNKQKSLLALTVLSSIISQSTIAADVEAGVVKKVPDMESSPLSINSPASMSDTYLASPSGDITTQAGEASGGKMLAAAASGISYFEIGYVQSSYAGEAISGYQTSTMRDHGGSALYIYVWQYGYGNVTNATMNGISRQVEWRQYRCGSDLHQCIAGETITGWLYGFDFSGQQSGSFSVGANSTAYPYGYWSDSIYIN